MIQLRYTILLIVNAFSHDTPHPPLSLKGGGWGLCHLIYDAAYKRPEKNAKEIRKRTVCI
jgi:hypothetical protein